MDITHMSVEEIKKIIAEYIQVPQEIMRCLRKDSRVSVQKIYQQLKKRKFLLKKEEERLANLNRYEEKIISWGYNLIAGVDEAGRGPLAGPVVAAAVILPRNTKIYGLDDSKKLPVEKREKLAAEIKEKAVSWAVGVATVQYIDRFNIYNASIRAMSNAVIGLGQKPEYLLIDAIKLDNLDIPQLPLVGGDGLSASIAAASILAKVTRDRLMQFYDKKYPQYGFARHKGYGTSAHLEAIAEFGPCPIHRRSFNLTRKK